MSYSDYFNRKPCIIQPKKFPALIPTKGYPFKRVALCGDKQYKNPQLKLRVFVIRKSFSTRL